MRDKAYYEKLFSRYPDIVTISQLRLMLGGISEKLARKLLMQNHIKHYMIRRAYVIPKAYLWGAYTNPNSDIFMIH